MKYLVEVDESIFASNTYLVEAESEKAARKDMLEGYGEGILELVATYHDESEITNVHSVKPYKE
jgi:hypothetical protein